MATPSKRKSTSKHKTVSPSSSSKKKRPSTPSGNGGPAEMDVITMETEESRDSPVSTDTEKIHVFKDSNFVHSSVGSSGVKRTRVWKNLKQVIAAERSLPWKPEDATYGLIDAPPSFKPAMKYSDLSGLQAKYIDPQTKLRYTTSEEYSRIRMMPSDLVTGCLTLRKAIIPV